MENQKNKKEYQPAEIEPKWQKIWDDTMAHRASDEFKEAQNFYNFGYVSLSIRRGACMWGIFKGICGQ